MLFLSFVASARCDDYARRIGQDRLRVIVPIKKHKNERWTFKIISEEKVGN